MAGVMSFTVVIKTLSRTGKWSTHSAMSVLASELQTRGNRKKRPNSCTLDTGDGAKNITNRSHSPLNLNERSRVNTTGLRIGIGKFLPIN